MSELAFQKAIQHHQQGDIKNAQRLYMDVLRNEPQHALALRNLGLIALETGHIDDAIDLYQRAMRIRSDVASWKSELAQVYSRAGDGIAAKNQLLSALRIEPQNSLFLYLLGNLYTDLGQMPEAIQAYRDAIRINPAQARVYSALSHLAVTGDYKFTPNEQKQLQHQANNPHLSADDLSHIHFALANLSQRKKQLDKAFDHFCQANQLKKESTPEWQRFKPEQLSQELADVRAIFSEQFITDHQDFGISSEVPVFIVGMPRTGTTLIERILAGHPAIVGRGELMHIKTLARDSLRFKTQQPYPQNLLQIQQEDLRILARQHVQRILGKDRNALRVVDKMPTNYQMLGLIYLLFPNARVIHTIRDPMDTLWSCFTRNLSARFSNDFADLKHMYDHYRAFMDLWRQRLPLRILDFHYEDLVSDFENQARTLIDFLDLEWHPDCLQYNKQQAQIGTASKMQVRKPIYRSAVHAWKKYETQLQPWREQMDDYYKNKR